MANLTQPAFTHTASMVLEDAVVLGTLFSHLKSEDQITRLLYAYEEIRQGRTSKVRAQEVSNASLLLMPPGPEQKARDASFRRPRSELEDEDSLKAELEGLFELFGYDAYDAAEVAFYASSGCCKYRH
jgi:salicylate hydroxylase